MNKKHPTCLTCKYCVYSKETLAQEQGECWYEPPQALPIMGQDANGNPKMVGKFSINPPVMLKRTFCGHYEEDLIQIAPASELDKLARGGAGG